MATWKGSYGTGYFANAPQLKGPEQQGDEAAGSDRAGYPANMYDHSQDNPEPEGSWTHCITVPLTAAPASMP